jgi:3-hydroxyisobutyrate dehydrogenase-like beta-hydroxyacid dehydrogenase
MEVGFIGLGRMGAAMATNIAKAGHQVRAWNRSAVATDRVQRVSSPQDAFQADVVFTMLSDDAAIRDVLLTPDILAHARPGLVHVVSSTISVEFAEELSSRHAQAGVGYVSAPVFGRPEAAEAAQLAVVAAGEIRAVEKVRPLLDIIGRRVWILGTQPKEANACKVAGNMMISMAIEAMAEAVALTTSNGLGSEAFFDVMLNSLFGCRAYETYSAKIAAGDFEPGFRMRLGLKDLSLAAAAAKTASRRLPMLDAVRQQMSEAVEAGLGEKDWSAIADYTLHAPG